MADWQWVVLAAVVIVGLPGLATAADLGLLALASLGYRQPDPHGGAAPVSFLVLVPAHNEEKVLGATLAAITADLRDGDRVLVVADRCSDATADIARAHGALVLERPDGSEPGRAAARHAGVRHALSLDWDAMVMIDADSVIEPGFFDAAERGLGTGALALQARSEAATGPRLLDQAWLAAFALQGVLMPRGRDRLRALVRLRGTGMVLARSVVEQFRFRAPASEDLWFSLDLCLAGVVPRHLESARLRSVNAGSWEVAGNQRVRYEAGRMTAAKAFAGPLLRHRTLASVEAAWYLVTPPFAPAVLLLVLAAAGAFAAGLTAAGVVMAAGLVVLALVVCTGLVEAGAGPRTWAALLVAPWYLVWKAAVQLRAVLSVARGVDTYGATPR